MLEQTAAMTGTVQLHQKLVNLKQDSVQVLALAVDLIASGCNHTVTCMSAATTTATLVGIWPKALLTSPRHMQESQTKIHRL